MGWLVAIASMVILFLAWREWLQYRRDTKHLKQNQTPTQEKKSE